jgi:hypothetical protein
MLLNEIVEGPIDIICEIEDNIVFYAQDINESTRIGIGYGNGKGGLVSKSLQGLTGFAKAHPWITSAAVLYGVNALKNYKKNKRKTVTFYTKDTQEKLMYKDIVKTLMATGKYRKQKETFVDGGYLWVLKRLN